MSILNKFLQTDTEAAQEKEKQEKKLGVEVKESAGEKTQASPAVSSAATKQLPRRILIRPIITEKSSLLMSQNQYVFEVADTANKITVAAAIKDMYGVTPVRVQMLTVPMKERIRGRIKGIRSGWKKAIVVLPEGKSIRVSEGGA